jgi:hypothetical protein
MVIYIKINATVLTGGPVLKFHLSAINAFKFQSLISKVQKFVTYFTSDVMLLES